MVYVLESEKEFQRLEKQSHTTLWHPKEDLTDFLPNPKGKILDAGCGSGIVTRYLAQQFPEAQIWGCDQSKERVSLAAQTSQSFQNIQYFVENLTSLSFESNTFSEIICRFVLEHLSEAELLVVIREMFRCLQPGGQICLIDIDGLVSNLYPQTPLISRLVSRLLEKRPVDLHIGRKLPFLLSQQPFKSIRWKIRTISLQGEALHIERELMKERFDQVFGVIAHLLGSEGDAQQFIQEYLESLDQPGSVLFYNQFIVIAEKPTSHS